MSFPQNAVAVHSLPENITHAQARQLLPDDPAARMFYDIFFEMGDTPKKALLRALSRLETLPSSPSEPS
jgi:hypothetical protein